MAKQPANILVEQTSDGAEALVASLTKSVICQAVGERRRCHLALAGGTTPRGLYALLAQGALTGEVPWQAVEFFFGDERDVPHDNVDSNYRMAQRTLLDHLPITPSQVHPMPADARDLDAAAQRYENELRQIVPSGDNGIPRLDLVLLGMGGDGHTASLFPGTEAVDESQRLVVAQFVPVLGRHRMTITFPLINASRNVIMLITGDDKAQAVAEMLSLESQAKSRIPAAGVCPTDGKLFVVLDAAAARLAHAHR